MNSNEQTNTFYDHFSRDNPTAIGEQLKRKFLEKVFNFIRPADGAKVLEIGPGRGMFANICFKNNIDYYAVEPNDKLAEALEKKGAKVARQTVPPIPQIAEGFDAIFMINSMEHMDTMKDALQVTKEARKLLSPNGWFVVVSPDFLSFRHHR